MKKLLDLLTRYQLVLILAALVAGLAQPRLFLVFNDWNGFFLQIIMLATGLRLDYGEFFRQARDWRTLVLANGTMLVGMPFLVAIPLTFFAPDWILPFVLAAAMPTGLTAPAVVTILGGRTSLGVLISVSTSLLAPFIIPLVLRVMAAQTVVVDTWAMMLNIAWVVIFPIALAAVIQRTLGAARIAQFSSPIRVANLTAFALVIASVAASSAAVSLGAGQGTFFGIGFDGLIIIILMTVFWLGMAWLASAMLAWRQPIDRLTVAFCLVYMNTTLGVWIADTFFRETGIAPKLVAIFVASTLVLPLFKFFMPKEKRPEFRKAYAVERH